MSVKLELKGFEDIKPIIDPKMWDKAFKRTVNDIVSQAFTQTRKSITSKWNINIKKVSANHYAFQSKQTKEIKKRSGHMFIHKARMNENEVVIGVSSKGGVPLILFPHKEFKISSKGKVSRVTKKTKITKKDKKVIGVKILKTGKETILRSSFKATMKSGHTGFFVRRTKSRLPILEKKSVSVTHMFATAEWEGVKGFEKILQKMWDKKSGSRFDFYLMKTLNTRS